MNQQSALDTFKKLTQMGLKVEVVNIYTDKTDGSNYMVNYGDFEMAITIAFGAAEGDDEYIKTVLQLEVG